MLVLYLDFSNKLLQNSENDLTYY